MVNNRKQLFYFSGPGVVNSAVKEHKKQEGLGVKQIDKKTDFAHSYKRIQIS